MGFHVLWSPNSPRKRKPVPRTWPELCPHNGTTVQRRRAAEISGAVLLGITVATTHICTYIGRYEYLSCTKYDAVMITYTPTRVPGTWACHRCIHCQPSSGVFLLVPLAYQGSMIYTTHFYVQILEVTKYTICPFQRGTQSTAVLDVHNHLFC